MSGAMRSACGLDARAARSGDHPHVAIGREPAGSSGVRNRFNTPLYREKHGVFLKLAPELAPDALCMLAAAAFCGSWSIEVVE
jgi:hypothetical protein